jgi:NNP family nitrate/nitrite transporter-like MFS transporter
MPEPSTSAALPSIVPPSAPLRAYHLQVSKDQNDRAKEIRLGSLKRPHMRAFHAAWLSFFTAFFMWFAVSPLLSVIQQDLALTRQDIWLSTICSDMSTVLARFLVGSACDVFGARLPMGVVLILAAIPTALLGTVQSLTGLCLARFAIGIAGSSFVMAQYWMGTFFVKERIGTANAIVAGWGNAGGGFAQIIVGAVLFPLFSHLLNDEEMAWRSIFVFPAVAAIAVAWLIVTQTDDAPQGYYAEMKRLGTMDLQAPSFMSCTAGRNVWLLAIAYGCSFGVEISLNNAGSLYFADEFGLGTEAAAAAAATLGLTNLFARAVGGILSDAAMKRFGMQGRLALCVATMLLQGGATLALAFGGDTLAAAIVLLALTSCGVHLTEGAIFGIVPYINPAIAGQIAGLVGLGGNLGGVVFGICFHQLPTYQSTFGVMGVAALVAGTTVFGGIFIPGQATLWTNATSLEAMNERVAAEDGTAPHVTRIPSPAVLPTVLENASGGGEDAPPSSQNDEV